MITPEELEQYKSVRRRVADLLEPFLIEADQEMQRRRVQELDIRGDLFTVPHFIEYVSAETWMLEGDQVVVYSSWGEEEDHHIPTEFLYGQLTGTEWVAQIWAEWEAKREERERDYQEKQRAELRRLLEKYPDEVQNA